MSLLTILSEDVTDPRRSQGLRTTLPQLFSMIIISNMCGHFGGRGVSRFSKIHEATFTEQLGLKHGVPSHVTFSEVLNKTSEKQLIIAFNKWSSGFVDLKKGIKVSGDGKALASTVTNSHSGNQTFTGVVSLFCQQSGLVHSIQRYENAKESEIGIVQYLVNQLKVKGLILFF